MHAANTATSLLADARPGQRIRLRRLGCRIDTHLVIVSCTAHSFRAHEASDTDGLIVRTYDLARNGRYFQHLHLRGTDAYLIPDD